MCAFYLSDVSRGREPNHKVGVRRLLANACVMQRVYLSSHFVSFRNISQNCPMPSSPVNVTFCPSTSSAQINLRELSSYASFLTNRLSQAAVGCLMLAYSFSPRVHSIPWGKGTHKQKSEHCLPDNAISKVQCAPRIILNRFLLIPTDNNFHYPCFICSKQCFIALFCVLRRGLYFLNFYKKRRSSLTLAS